jgi:hypothetical protein
VEKRWSRSGAGGTGDPAPAGTAATVGGEQKLHFRQLKAVLARMQLAREPRVEHISFGMLRLPEGKMSTRKGRVIFLEEVLDRARDEVLRIICEKDPELADAEGGADGRSRRRSAPAWRSSSSRRPKKCRLGSGFRREHPGSLML